MATSASREATGRAELLTDKVDTPALDDRSYRVIRLPNKLEVLVVHDSTTDKASASLCVNVGNFSDDAEMPGMAHAVEHLLFMGTEKYPKENAYNQYLSAHSGYSNAYTATTETNYFFEVAASSQVSEQGKGQAASEDETTSPLYGALDRFAQFFVAPLFLSSTLDRELQAVDSENKKNLQSDTWRLHQLSKSLSNPAHPHCHFSTGNLETLKDKPLERGVDIRSEFINFYERHYSANRMKLCVLGREPLDQLETWVTDLFSAVKNKDLPQNRWDDLPPLTENELGTRCFAKPVMESRSLELIFPSMDEEFLFETQPSRYLSHLIGHEGPGSILAYIKGKGWANELSAGSMPICPGSALFIIQVRLTEDGMHHYEDIIRVIFQYITLVKEIGPLEWIVDEMKNIAEIDFRFRQKQPASKFTSSTSTVMQKPYPREWILSGSSLLRKYDPELIQKGIEYFRPDNFRYSVVSHEFGDELDEKEKWYGTQYKYESIPKESLESFEKAARLSAKERIPELQLPHRNEFLPKTFDVEKKEVETPVKAPKLIRNDAACRLWWKKDDQFWVPKANLFITLRNPLTYTTPRDVVKTALFCELVTDALVEYSYDAELAGLDYSLSSHSIGLDVDVSGYNDRMAVLLEKVLLQMRDLHVKPDRFKIVKERLLRGHRNWDFQQPYHQVGEYTRWLNSDVLWINDQLTAELPHIEVEDVQTFIPQLLGQAHVEALAHGNLYKEDALKLVHLVESVLKCRPLPESQWHIRRSLIPPTGSNFIYQRDLKDPANVNHCIEYYVHVGDKKIRAMRAKLFLFAQATEEPAFNQLRTNEQLGYVVFSGVKVFVTTMGYRVLIQSERPADYLEGRIEAFLKQSGQVLKDMTNEDFDSHKRSLINILSERLKNLAQETRRFWSHIASEYLDFQQVENTVAEVAKLNKEDLLEFYLHYIDPASTQRAKVSVHLLAQATSQDVTKKLDPAEQKDKFLLLISQFLNSEGIEGDVDKIDPKFANVDISQGDATAITETIESYLKTDLKLSIERVDAVMKQGKDLLAAALPSLGITLKTDAIVEEVRPAIEPTIIKDVHEFKTSLPVSAGVTPVQPLHEFEELESKL